MQNYLGCREMLRLKWSSRATTIENAFGAPSVFHAALQTQSVWNGVKKLPCFLYITAQSINGSFYCTYFKDRCSNILLFQALEEWVQSFLSASRRSQRHRPALTTRWGRAAAQGPPRCSDGGRKLSNAWLRRYDWSLPVRYQPRMWSKSRDSFHATHSATCPLWTHLWSRFNNYRNNPKPL